MVHAYKYRIYPNKNQQQFIKTQIGGCRYIFNWGLNLRINNYKQENKYTSYFDTTKALTQLKQQDGYEWLYNINANALEASLKNLDIAYTAFFKYKKGFPKFKSKKNDKQSFKVRQSISLEILTKKLFIPKLKTPIKIVISKPLIGIIKNGTITKTASGKYFISIQTEDATTYPELPTLDINASLGIDLGLTHFATLSNGTKIENPRLLNKSLKQLKKLQRRLSKKMKGSNNRNKARIKVARLHEYIANARLDFLHKLTTKLINENQVDTFCLEDLNIVGMMKNHKLAKSISDASWSKFIELLTYKCKWYGKNLLFIGRFEPSSKMCSCGAINHSLTLKDRIWQCQSCLATHDRDILAANNIKHFAFNQQNMMYIGTDRSKFKPAESKKVLLVETGNYV